MTPTSPTFDASGALAAGASEDDVLGYLTKSRPYDIQGAMSAGASKRQIIDYLSSKPSNTVPGMEKLGGTAPGVRAGAQLAPPALQGPPKGIGGRALENLPGSLANATQRSLTPMPMGGDQMPPVPNDRPYPLLNAAKDSAVGLWNKIRHPLESFADDPVGTVGAATTAAQGGAAALDTYPGRLMKEAAGDPFIRREVGKELAGRGAQRLIRKVTGLPLPIGSSPAEAGEPSLGGHWNAAKIRARVGTYPDRPAPAWTNIPDSESAATGVASAQPPTETPRLPSGRVPGTGQPAPPPPPPSPRASPPWAAINPRSQSIPPVNPIYGPLPSGRVPGGSLRAQPPTPSVESSLPAEPPPPPVEAPIHPAHADNLEKVADDAATVLQNAGITSDQLIGPKMTADHWNQVARVVDAKRGVRAGNAQTDLSKPATQRMIVRALQQKEGKLTGSIRPPTTTPTSPGVRILRPQDTQVLRDRPDAARIAQQLWPEQ